MEFIYYSIYTYLYRCYAKYPNGISHFFQECMPEGYSQERVTRFHDDGIFKTYYEIHYNKGLVMSKVTMQADGFKKDSPILANRLKCMELAIETTYACEGGLRSLAHHVSNKVLVLMCLFRTNSSLHTKYNKIIDSHCRPPL